MKALIIKWRYILKKITKQAEEKSKHNRLRIYKGLHCGIDSILGDADGSPEENRELFLKLVLSSGQCKWNFKNS